MYETIVVGTVAMSLLVTAVFEIADSVVDRRRLAAQAPASQARRPRAVIVSSGPVAAPAAAPISALPEAA